MRRMTGFRNSAGLALAAALAAVPSHAQTDRERFELWTGCGPVRVVTDLAEQPHDGAAGTGLAEADVAAAARARLHGGAGAEAFLYVNVAVGGGAYAVTLLLFKPMRDLVSGGTGPAVSWFDGRSGTHAADAGHILSAVAENTDRFIGEYLQANADACPDLHDRPLL